jgi:hypothetical protein
MVAPKAMLRTGALTLQVSGDVNVVCGFAALISHQVPFWQVTALLGVGLVSKLTRRKHQVG